MIYLALVQAFSIYRASVWLVLNLLTVCCSERSNYNKRKVFLINKWVNKLIAVIRAIMRNLIL